MLKKITLSFFYLLFLFSFAYSQDKTAFVRDLELAQQLVSAGRSAEAVPVLEKLKSQSPENRAVFVLLCRAYLDTKAYPKLEEHLKTWQEKHPEDWVIWTQLGDLYLKTGEKSQAEEAFKKALKSAPDSAESYHLVASVYLANKEIDKAVETFKSGIRKLGNPPLLLRDLGGIYEVSSDYTQAIEYYFAWAKADTTKYEEVEKKIMQLIESGEKSEEIEKGLKKGIELEPKRSLGYKLYGDLLLKKDMLSQAFELFKTADLLSSSRGDNLLLFAQACLKKKSYELSLKTGQYLKTSCQAVDCVIQAQFVSGSSLEGLGRYNEALSVYQKIAQDYPLREVQAEAYFQTGNIFLEHLQKKDEAIFWYRKILPLKETSPYPGALIKLGEIFVLKDQLDSALFHYEKSLQDPQAKPVYEELNFRRAEVYFYQGELEKASEAYQKIIKDFPKGLFVNNSLERLNLIKDNLEVNRPFLKDFSKALLYIYQANLTEAENTLEKIIQAKVPTLSDAAVMEKSSLLRRKKDFSSSILEYQSLFEKFPQSFYLPFALKSIGDIYLQDLKNNQKARETYEVFLKKFPTSLYVQEVREKLKGLSGGALEIP